MKFFHLDELGDSKRVDYCFVENQPKGLSVLCLKRGARLRERHPDGWGEVRAKLGDDSPGLLLPSCIGNTDSILIFSKALVDAVLEHNLGEVEVVPFVLMNHRDRVHSRDYVFLNPIGNRDVLDLSKTECGRHDNGEVFGITRMVLDGKKLANAPDLFRLQEDTGTYICSEKLVTDLRQRDFTNLVFHELEVA